MGFDLEGALNEGYSKAEIADYLATSNRFDVQGARKEGYSDDDIIGHLMGSGQPSVQQKAVSEAGKLMGTLKLLESGGMTPETNPMMVDARRAAASGMQGLDLINKLELGGMIPQPEPPEPTKWDRLNAAAASTMNAAAQIPGLVSGAANVPINMVAHGTGAGVSQDLSDWVVSKTPGLIPGAVEVPVAGRRRQQNIFDIVNKSMGDTSQAVSEVTMGKPDDPRNALKYQMFEKLMQDAAMIPEKLGEAAFLEGTASPESLEMLNLPGQGDKNIPQALAATGLNLAGWTLLGELAKKATTFPSPLPKPGTYATARDTLRSDISSLVDKMSNGKLTPAEADAMSVLLEKNALGKAGLDPLSPDYWRAIRNVEEIRDRMGKVPGTEETAGVKVLPEPQPTTEARMSNPIVADAIINEIRQPKLPGPAGMDMNVGQDFTFTPPGMADIVIEANRRRLEGGKTPMLPEPAARSAFSPELADLILKAQGIGLLPEGPSGPNMRQGFELLNAPRGFDLVPSNTIPLPYNERPEVFLRRRLAELEAQANARGVTNTPESDTQFNVKKTRGTADIPAKETPEAEGGSKYPIKFREQPTISDRMFNENLLVYLDEPNSPQMKERFGREKIKNISSNISRADGQYGSWRYLYRNEKGEIVGSFQGVSSREHGDIISNIYVRPDYRRKGVGTELLKAIEKEKKRISIDSGLSGSGAAFMGVKLPNPTRPSEVGGQNIPLTSEGDKNYNTSKRSDYGKRTAADNVSPATDSRGVGSYREENAATSGAQRDRNAGREPESIEKLQGRADQVESARRQVYDEVRQEYLKHATYRDKIPSIIKHGLDPNKSGDYIVANDTTKRLYLARETEYVSDFGDIILRVKKSDLDPAMLKEIEMARGGTEYQYFKDIPPHLIEYEGLDGTWKALRKKESSAKISSDYELPEDIKKVFNEANGFLEKHGIEGVFNVSEKEMVLDPANPRDRSILEKNYSKEEINEAIKNGEQFIIDGEHRAVWGEESPGKAPGQAGSYFGFFHGFDAATVWHEVGHSLHEHGRIATVGKGKESTANHIRDLMMEGKQDQVEKLIGEHKARQGLAKEKPGEAPFTRTAQELKTGSSHPSLPGDAIIPKDSPFASKNFSIIKVTKDVSKNLHKKESRVFEVSFYPGELANRPDGKTAVTLKTVEEARKVNTNKERVADWAKIYDKAEPITKWANVKKINKDGKLAGLPVVSLTKGCQRYRATLERVENGILPKETRIEACYGGDCWVNKQFNAVFGTFENMEVRDLQLADKNQIKGWLKSESNRKWLDSGPFIRMGQQGDDSHLFASGVALEWLKQAKDAGIKNKTVFISAGYAPVTEAQYAALKPYKDLFEIHFSNSGWFDKNEILMRLGEFQAAREAGLPASIRLITNRENVSGISMPNEKFLYDQMKKMGVAQSEVLETPFHDDGAKGKPRSEPTHEFKYICCETGKCGTCGAKCLTKIDHEGSVSASYEVKKANLKKSPAVEESQYSIRKVKKAVAKDTGDILGDIRKTADEYLGSISTRLGNIDPSIKAVMRKFEFQRGVMASRAMKRVIPFMEKVEKIPSPDKEAFDLARKNGDPTELRRIVTKYGLGKEYHELRLVLAEMHKNAKDLGYDIGYHANYHPRLLNDSEGFLKYFYKQKEWPIIKQAIIEKGKDLGRKLTDDEKAKLINTMLRGYPSGQISLGKPAQMKERGINKVTPKLNEFYMDSDAALVRYIYDMSDAIEAGRLFGKGRKAKVVGSMDDTIGSYVLDLLENDKIKPEDERPLTEILRARFNEVGTSGNFGLYKNLAYLDTMGSFISAITQIGDVAWAMYKNGLWQTSKAMGKAYTGRSPIKKEDLGIERMAEEFADNTKTALAVQKVFKWSGLTLMDDIGKESLITSTWEVAKKKVKTPKGEAELRKELKPIFEGETDQLVADIKAGKVTDNVRLYLFNVLSDFQPISLSEMPQKYLTAGNGRIFYMLKTFTLKQFDAFRKEAFKLMATPGSRLKGMRNLLHLAACFVAANAASDVIKNLLLGRPTKLTDLTVDNILRLIGISKFVTWQARQEGVRSAVVKQIAPPFKAGDALFKDIQTAGDKKGMELPQSIPIVGKPYYWWFGKGADKSEKERRKP